MRYWFRLITKFDFVRLQKRLRKLAWFNLMIKILKKEKQFSVLLAGNLFSKIGDGIHEFVFIVTVLKVTNNEIVNAGVIYFFRFIPYLILGPIGGVLSDKLSRKFLMSGADLCRVLIIGVFCTLLITNQIGPTSLALLGMLMTAFRTIFQPAFQASIPSLVRSENLPVANGATQIVGEIGGLIGPALGAAGVAMVASPGYVLLLDAVTYLLSALCVLSVQIPIDHVAAEDSNQRLTLRSLYGNFWKNLKQVLARSQLFITIIYSSVCIFLVGAALQILIPSMIKTAGFTDSMIGYAMSLSALGTISGALLCAKITGDFSTRKLMRYWGLYGLALSLLPFFMANPATILASCFVLGVFGAFVDVVLPTVIQRLSSNTNIGKNFSLFSTLANTGEALSGSLAGLLVLFSSVGISVTVIGLLTASVAYLGKLKSAGQNE